MFVPNVKKFPQAMTEMSHLQEPDRQTENILPLVLIVAGAEA